MHYLNKVETSIDELALSFRTQGFVKIKNIFTNEFVNYLKERIDESINIPVDKYQAGFNRLAFDLFNHDKIVLGLMKDNYFRKIMSEVTSKKLFFTQALAFELKKNKSTGFPWHIGTQSFGYQKAADFGCTIWMPLDKISTKKQRGGMSYVPENIISGKFMYEQIDPSIVNHIQERHENNDNPQLNDYLKLRDGILNDDNMKTLLDHFGTEDDYSLGDILLFNKNVIHRSIKLEEGELDKRGAFAMRFIDSNSTYDKKRALSLEYPRELFNYDGCSTFHLDICKDENEIISKSNYYPNDSIRNLHEL
jgi:hypothetical protein